MFRFSVSIPYRYATNAEQVSLAMEAVFEFQFLIGTLQTGAGGYLAGSFAGGFQFLIGTLQTKFYTSLQILLPVSIPYRYATNSSSLCD